MAKHLLMQNPFFKMIATVNTSIILPLVQISLGAQN